MSNARITRLVQSGELPMETQIAKLSFKRRAVLVRYGIEPEDYAQEVSLALLTNNLTVLCNSASGEPIQAHMVRFRCFQLYAFRTLIRPFRAKKRGERVISYKDPRWNERAHDESLSRFYVDLSEKRIADPGFSGYPGSIETSFNPEARWILRIDLTRLVQGQGKRIPVRLWHVVLGNLGAKEAVLSCGLPEREAWKLLREARLLARERLRDHAPER